MGARNSDCPAKGGCRGLFNLVLLVTHLRSSTVFVRLVKPDEKLHTRGIFVKATQ
jgi:hypothetical protein